MAIPNGTIPDPTTVILAIKAKTDPLPASPANEVTSATIKTSIVVFEGVTTADGAIGGTSLVCSDLIGKEWYFAAYRDILVTSPGFNQGGLHFSIGFDDGTGTISFDPLYPFGDQILAGVAFKILASRSPAIPIYERLTAARAALLDQITALRMAELDAANMPADVGTLLARLTAARAGYLDNLIGTPTTGTFSLVNNILEQDCLIFAVANQIVDIELDMSNLVQTNTVREYVQVDGANYRQVSAKVFPTDFDAGTKCASLSFTQKNSLYKVTLQASIIEGSAKNVPYRYIVRDLS